MARPLRIEKVGGWYHVTARGAERKPIFRNDTDRRHFLEAVAEMVGRFRVRLHCFVLMGNHYHLLLELREPNLSRAIQWLNVSYSIWFNLRHRAERSPVSGALQVGDPQPGGMGVGIEPVCAPKSRAAGEARFGKSRAGGAAPRGRSSTAKGASARANQAVARLSLEFVSRLRWSGTESQLAGMPERVEAGRRKVQMQV